LKGNILTPKVGTGKGLTCGPSLVKNAIQQENLLKGFGKDACDRQYAIIRQEDYLRLKKGSFREYVMTWPGCKEGTN
jgi:hypothetical protein